MKRVKNQRMYLLRINNTNRHFNKMKTTSNSRQKFLRNSVVTGLGWARQPIYLLTFWPGTGKKSLHRWFWAGKNQKKSLTGLASMDSGKDEELLLKVLRSGV